MKNQWIKWIIIVLVIIIVVNLFKYGSIPVESIITGTTFEYRRTGIFFKESAFLSNFRFNINDMSNFNDLQVRSAFAWRMQREAKIWNLHEFILIDPTGKEYSLIEKERHYWLPELKYDAEEMLWLPIRGGYGSTRVDLDVDIREYLLGKKLKDRTTLKREIPIQFRIVYSFDEEEEIFIEEFFMIARPYKYTPIPWYLAIIS